MAFSATELLASGYSAADARTMGLKPVELKEGGYSLEEIKSAGFSQWQLRDSFPSWMLIGKLRPPATASKVSLPSERLPSHSAIQIADSDAYEEASSQGDESVVEPTSY